MRMYCAARRIFSARGNRFLWVTSAFAMALLPLARMCSPHSRSSSNLTTNSEHRQRNMKIVVCMISAVGRTNFTRVVSASLRPFVPQGVDQAWPGISPTEGSKDGAMSRPQCVLLGMSYRQRNDHLTMEGRRQLLCP